MAQQYDSVDDYIDSFPPELQTVLQAAREAIHAAATPGLKESISYGIPTFTIGGGPLSTLAVGRSTSASIQFQSSTKLSSRSLLRTYPGKALRSSRWPSRSRTR
jgi:hypothetical protein